MFQVGEWFKVQVHLKLKDRPALERSHRLPDCGGTS